MISFILSSEKLFLVRIRGSVYLWGEEGGVKMDRGRGTGESSGLMEMFYILVRMGLHRYRNMYKIQQPAQLSCIY